MRTSTVFGVVTAIVAAGTAEAGVSAGVAKVGCRRSLQGAVGRRGGA